MPKCELCGKEILFPFKYPYCGRTFCSEHKIPENHQCQSLPKERTPFSAPRYAKPIVTSDRTPWKDPRVGRCPECRQYSEEMAKFDAKTMSFKCQFCGHEWTQLKKEPYDIIESKDLLELDERQEAEKPKKKRWFLKGLRNLK